MDKYYCPDDQVYSNEPTCPICGLPAETLAVKDDPLSETPKRYSEELVSDFDSKPDEEASSDWGETESLEALKEKEEDLDESASL